MAIYIDITKEYYLNTIYSNMDGIGGHFAKWSKSKTDTMWYHLQMESKKIKHTCEYNKKENHRYRDLLSGMQNDTIILENNLEVFYKIKHTLTIWFSKYSHWYLNYVHTETCA